MKYINIMKITYTLQIKSSIDDTSVILKKNKQVQVNTVVKNRIRRFTKRFLKLGM